MGRAAGTLGQAPAAAAEGPTPMEGPTTAAVGPAAGAEGPWCTRGLKE